MRRLSVFTATALLATSLTVLPGVASAANTNLALESGVTASASGQEVEGRWGPELAIDNDKGGDFTFRDQRDNFRSHTASRWSANNDDESWLQLDLPNPARIDEVVVTWGKQFSRDFEIQISKDAQTWTPIKTGLSGRASIEQTVDLKNNGAGVEAKHIRLVSHRRSQTYAISVWEFEVFGEYLPTSPNDSADTPEDNTNTAPETPSPSTEPTETTTLKNLALEKHVVVSAIGQELDDKWGPELVVDGNDGGPQRDVREVHLSPTASRWSALNQDDIWLNIDLGARSALNKVDVTWGKQWSTNFDIWLSLDGNTWNKHRTGLTGVKSTTQTINLLEEGNPVEARHVRLVSHRRSAQYATSIWEIAVYGVALEAPSLDNTQNPQEKLPALVPLPREYELTDADTFYTLHPQAEIIAAENAHAEAELFAAGLRKATGFKLPVVSASTDEIADITFVNQALPNLTGVEKEHYTLTVAENGVTVTGSTAHGLFNGTQTLRQLFGGWAFFPHPTNNTWQIPALRIDDQPRFPHRGNMLDPARSFHSVEEMKQAIDAYAAFKFNVLHVHLVDDQGWRIEITNDGKTAEDTIDYSLLTEISGKTAMGAGRSRFNSPAGKTGFYTQQQWRELVAYARARHIDVIPEIDLPGHSNAALHAIPQLNTPGSSHDGTRTTDGSPITDPAQYLTAPLQDTGDVGATYLDLDDPATVRFVKHVVKQVSELTGSQYFHFGGDEAHALSRKENGAVYRRFIEKIAQLIREQGLTPITWNEAAVAVQQPGDVIQLWNGGHQAVKNSVRTEGAKAIYSSADRLYYPQSPDHGIAGPTWACGGPCRLTNWYNYDPARILNLNDHEILGVEAAQWNEHVRNIQDAFFMQFPRTLAAAEVAWTPQNKRSGKLDFFKKRAASLSNSLSAQGVDFYHSEVNPTASLTGAVSPASADSPVGYLFSPATFTTDVSATRVIWDNGEVSAVTVSQPREFLPGNQNNHENRQQNGIFVFSLVDNAPAGVSEGVLETEVNGVKFSATVKVQANAVESPTDSTPDTGTSSVLVPETTPGTSKPEANSVPEVTPSIKISKPLSLPKAGSLNFGFQEKSVTAKPDTKVGHKLFAKQVEKLAYAAKYPTGTGSWSAVGVSLVAGLLLMGLLGGLVLHLRKS